MLCGVVWCMLTGKAGGGEGGTVHILSEKKNYTGSTPREGFVCLLYVHSSLYSIIRSDFCLLCTCRYYKQSIPTDYTLSYFLLQAHSYPCLSLLFSLANFVFFWPRVLDCPRGTAPSRTPLMKSPVADWAYSTN